VPPISAEDIPQTDGPNASMPFGDATQFRQENRAVQSAGTSARNPFPGMPGGQPGQPQQPMAAPQGGAQQPPPGPVQPAPPQGRGPGGQRLDIGNAFSTWDGDGLSDMRRLEMWANHPSRPRVINMLVDRAKGRRDTTGQ
jgi:hypothetical protein